MNTNNPNILFCFLSIVFLLHTKSITAQGDEGYGYQLEQYDNEVDDQKEFNYQLGSPKGPYRWGDRPGWETCKNGTMQSPIDLMNNRVMVVKNIRELVINYNPANGTLKNRGHDIMLKWEGGAGTIQINGTNYQLKQCHWHSISEHTLDGKEFDLEVHLVHEATDATATNKIAVIGLLYTFGAPDPFLSELDTHIVSISKQRTEVSVGLMDPRRLNVGGGEYYGYMGSLTTPPCTQGVIWTINKRIRTVSEEQVRQLWTAVDDSHLSNARPLQAHNNRPVQLYIGQS